MELWTWQGQDFCLHKGIVDHAKSGYVESEPNYLPAVRELAEYLGTDQFIWASRVHDLCFAGRVKYCLEVSEDNILAIIDGFLWNRRLGRKVLPPDALRDCWKQEAEERFPHESRRCREYENMKGDEYRDEPTPDDWLERAIRCGPESENPQYLLWYPIPKARIKKTQQ